MTWKRAGLLLLLALTLASFAPILNLIAAGIAADALDCPIDEGGAHPCLLAGMDIGGWLNAAEVLAWLMFVTWPGMLLSVIAWMWLGLRRRQQRQQRQRRRAARTAAATPS